MSPEQEDLRAAPGRPPGADDGTIWDTMEQIIRRFEEQWERGATPTIDDYLAKLEPGHRGRSTLLIELLHADLEYRIRARLPVSVRDYLKRFRDTLSDEQVATLYARADELRRSSSAVVTAKAYATPGPPRDSSSSRSSQTGPETALTPMPADAPVLPLAQPAPLLPSKFEVVAFLGAGGMGQVWRVRHTVLKRESVVKLILPEYALAPEARQRMLREAQAMERLAHLHAVAVYDVGLEPTPYIEMEYVPGKALDQIVKRGTPMPLDWTARLLEQLCDVLSAAHGKGIIHRDLKPSNLMLVDGYPDGQEYLKVLDFGVAKIVEADARTFTERGRALGSAKYMSPEQLRDSSRATPSFDIYAVGVILYELLTGQPPFLSTSLEDYFYDIVHTRVPPFAERNSRVNVPPGVEALVLRCLEKDPARRPASAAALARELRALVPAPRAPGIAAGDFPPMPERFEPIEKLGEGGMGAVWRVRHAVLGDRALKLILPQFALTTEARERLLREAKAMKEISSHPHAVTVHDVGLVPTPYIEMDYVAGRPLSKLLKRGTPMPLEWTAQVVGQLCDVLSAAHKKGIVHRDLKPSNLMLVDGQDDGEPYLKVIDLGIAKILDTDAPTFTEGRQTLGTWWYMSPEQVRDAAHVDARSDLFAVGVILYQLLTGQLPFWAENPIELAFNIVNTPAPPFRDKNPAAQVPPAVEALVLRCLEKDPARRPASAAALAEELRELVFPKRDEDKRWKPDRRVVLATVAVVLIAGMFALYRWLNPDPSLGVIWSDPVLKAGESEPLTVVVHPERHRSAALKAPPVATVNGPSRMLDLTPLPEGAVSTTWRYRVLPSPNAAPGLYTATFKVGSLERRVPIRVGAPDVVGVPGWERVKGALLERADDGRNYPEAIERNVPDVGPVMALLVIPKKGLAGAPGPFYIMRDKVWVGLFQAYARSGPPVSSEWREYAWDLRLPVLNVPGPEAEKFATWLGDKARGVLPTTDEWDAAAGFFLNDGRTGPYKESREPGDPPQAPEFPEIAVSRPGKPLNEAVFVGAATRDVSPFGCRDMSGNGQEWTRAKRMSSLRAASFEATHPFTFERIKMIRDGRSAENWAFDLKDLHPGKFIGFRVVIEPDLEK
jgi:serine/threonine protein kinase